MQGNLLYVNARVKSLENSMLTQVQLSRLIDADSVSDAFKILQECGYGQGAAVEDFRSYEHIIAEREREATGFFKENLIEKTGLDAVIVRNDYHNAKVLIKAKYMRLDKVEDMLLPDGLYSSAKMKEDIFNDDYSALPDNMAEALDGIDVAFADGNRSPRYIDVSLDRAMYKDMWARVKKYKQQVLVDWLTFTVDTDNLSAFIRSKKLGLDLAYFKDGFIDGGKLNYDWYAPLFDVSADAFREKAKYTDYGELCAAALEKNGLVSFETAVDNRINKMFKDNKYDLFSVAPIVGYYLGQLTEIKVVKLAVSAVKNKLDRALLRQRLRELYA